MGLRGVKHFREIFLIQQSGFRDARIGDLVLPTWCCSNFLVGSLFLQFLRKKKQRHFFTLRVHIWQQQRFYSNGSKQQPVHCVFLDEGFPTFQWHVQRLDFSPGNRPKIHLWSFDKSFSWKMRFWCKRRFPVSKTSSFFLRVPCEWRNLVLGFQTFFLRFIFYPAKIIQFDRMGRTTHVMFKLF